MIQKLLQVPNEEFSRGDPHPKVKNVYFDSLLSKNRGQWWVTKDKLPKLASPRPKLVGIPQEYIHQKGCGKGTLIQKVLQVPNEEFSRGDPHPNVKNIIFNSYRSDSEGKTQRWVVKNKLPNLASPRPKLVGIPQEYIHQKGCGRGSLIQKLLQVPNEEFSRGDPHPKVKNVYFNGLLSKNRGQWWVTKDKLSKSKPFQPIVKLVGIPQEYVHQKGSGKGTLIQKLLQVPNEKFSRGDPHPKVKNVYFYESRLDSKDKTQRWVVKDKLPKLASSRPKLVGIPQEFIHQSGSGKGSLNQQLLQVPNPQNKFVCRDPHPKVKNVYFLCYTSLAKGKTQFWVTEDKLPKLSNRRPKLVGVAKKYIHQKGGYIGLLNQKALQTPKGKFVRGDPHPKAKNIYFSHYSSESLGNIQQWCTSDKFTTQSSTKTKLIPDFSSIPEKYLRKQKNNTYLIDQKTLQIPNKEFARGDKHPEVESLFFCYQRSSLDSSQYWVTQEQLDVFIEKQTLARKKQYQILYSDENLHKKHLEKIKKWRNDNKSKQQGYNAKSRTKRVMSGKDAELRSRPFYRISKTLRERIRILVKKKDRSKGSIKLIGCSVAKLLKHLEEQFYQHPQSGELMTWENYGVHGWHVDHIRPCASFDLEDKKQQLECFNYKNLQPMWAEENLSKHASWNDDS